MLRGNMSEKKELASGNLEKEREKQVYKGRNELGIFQGWEKDQQGWSPESQQRNNLLST